MACGAVFQGFAAGLCFSPSFPWPGSEQCSHRCRSIGSDPLLGPPEHLETKSRTENTTKIKIPSVFENTSSFVRVRKHGRC